MLRSEREIPEIIIERAVEDDGYYSLYDDSIHIELLHFDIETLIIILDHESLHRIVSSLEGYDESWTVDLI